MNRVQLRQSYRSTTSKQFLSVFIYEEALFITKFPEIPGTHLIHLKRMKDWAGTSLPASFWAWFLKKNISIIML